MKKLWRAYSLLILFPLLVYGAQQAIVEKPVLQKPGKLLSFHFGKEVKRFLDFPQKRVTISENCGTDLSKMTCMAALSLKTVSFKSIPRDKMGSRNPGSVACTEVLHERVLIGTDSHRNEYSFCLYRDGSMVDNGTLAYYAFTH